MDHNDKVSRQLRLQEVLAQQKAIDEKQARLRLELDLFAKHFGRYKLGDIAKNYNGSQEFKVEKIDVRSDGYANRERNGVQITYTGARKTISGFHARCNETAWEFFKLEERCAGCGEPWPCSDSKRNDISADIRATHHL